MYTVGVRGWVGFGYMGWLFKHALVKYKVLFQGHKDEVLKKKSNTYKNNYMQRCDLCLSLVQLFGSQFLFPFITITYINYATIYLGGIASNHLDPSIKREPSDPFKVAEVS